MSDETTYWGILCRACSEPVAFDICPCHLRGPGAANVRPGAIRCVTATIIFTSRAIYVSFLPQFQSPMPPCNRTALHTGL